ncbi:MAG: D-alanyl-D-alanine endopeptidase [Betaproteobacteria bacterium]|nr:D-alanyl-D-alanine endopeptidase [Betaproteobacteria bacterium]MCX7194359.1 D-alanyl-D-alanine endopeptidase [Pseudomonadota bacterium]
MCKKLIMLVLLLVPALVVQAAPDKAITQKQVDDLTSTVLKHTSSPKLNSSIALIYDEQEQRPLYSKNANAVVPIASITKLMTAIVVLDAELPLEEKITISVFDFDILKGSHSRMRIGMTLTRGELLNLALMSSENRAAAALARTYPGGTNAAVAMMNAKALELGMMKTHFRDATGLNSGNTSTAQDLVKMLIAARQYNLIHKYSTTASHWVTAPGFPPLHFGNTNPLVKNASWNIGVSKTGYINEAGRCLVMHAHIMRRPVIIVLLDSQGKYTRVGDANRVKKWMESSATRGRITRRG